MKQLRRYFAKRVLIDKKQTLKPSKQFTIDQRVRKQARIIQDMLISPEEIQNSGQKIVNIDTMNYYQIMNMIDTDFNNFFADKKLNSKNYATYLQTLLSQKKHKMIQEAFSKMHLYDIQPNLMCYIFLIESYGQSKDLLKAESIFDEALEKFGWNIYLVNSMMYTYRYLKEYEKAMNLFQQTKLKGLQPSEVTYTNLIILCDKKRMYKKCWQLFKQAKNEDVQIDDFMIGVMIGICGQTQDAEKGLQLWNEMIKMPEIRLTALHYDALIKSLASRIDYCERALEIYEEMKYKKIQPSKQTFRYSLQAASKLGNIAIAYELALQLRNFNFQANSLISYFLIQTYSTALKNPTLPTNLKDKYFKDSWTIINNLIEKGKINSNNLNALLNVHISYNKILEAEEIVLPLFDTLNLKKNSKTYQIFFENFYNKRELQSVFNLYNKLQKNNNQLISRISLDIVLKSYFAVKDIDKIIQLLDQFIQRNQQPNRTTLIDMSKSKNIPDVILFRMNKFPFILKRSKKKRRVYGEDVQFVHVEGKIRNKAVQKLLNEQELRENHDEIQDEITSNMDKVHLQGHDDPELIDHEEFEEIDKDIKFKDYQDKLDESEADQDYEYEDYEDDEEYSEDYDEDSEDD